MKGQRIAKSGLIMAGSAVAVLMAVGCSGRTEQPIVQNIMQNIESPAGAMMKNADVSVRAIGMGVIPEGMGSQAQALAMGKRAAIADAYRQIGEKIYGIKVSATDTVKDMVAKNSSIKTEVSALVKNGNIEETVCQDGLCQVSMEVKIDRESWARLSGY